jgi:SAM-dependent methyltransferase
MSVMFEWKAGDFSQLLATCESGSELPYILRYMPRAGKIVEAGCGLGRYVAYLSQTGFDIEGIEINPLTVEQVKRIRPDLNVRQGDVSQMPYADDSVSGIISLGVVEHFIEGPAVPLREMGRVLKPGCYAVISVPSQNILRRAKTLSGYHWLRERLKGLGFLRRLFGKNPVPQPEKGTALSYAHLNAHGRFLEYRLTKREFERELVQAGFGIVESVPVAQMDGIYHEYGRAFVSFRNWRFHPRLPGKVVDRLFSGIPFFHNHMHLCVVRKEIPT